MTFDLKSLVVGAFIGSILSGLTMLALINVTRSKIPLTVEIAKMLIDEGKRGCIKRPYSIEGAGAYITFDCKNAH